MEQAFHPIDRATTTIAASTTTARGAIAKQPSGRHQLRIANNSGALAYYRAGDSTVEATNADVPLPDGAVEVVTVLNGDRLPVTHVAVLLASGSGDVFITTGHGL